jgi:hypothetical protein
MDCNTEREFLRNSLAYQMSLGSKELYHSNVWAWLVKMDRAFFKVFFPNENISQLPCLEVCREYQHRDLTFFLKSQPRKRGATLRYYLIENKIKSLPTEAQLESYSVDLAGYPLQGACLTGLFPTLDLTGLNARHRQFQWFYLSYETIGQRIKDIAEASANPIIKQNLSTIEEYCHIIQAFYDLLNAAFAQNQNRLEYDNGLDLEDPLISLDDVYKKFKASDFLAHAEAEITQAGASVPNGFVFDGQEDRLGFNRGNATITFGFHHGGDWDIQIGIQIEGTSYRRFLSIKPLSKEEKAISQEVFAQRVYEYGKTLKWFEEPTVQDGNRFLRGHRTSMKREPGHGTYNGLWLYQYYDLQDADKDYDALAKSIGADLLEAKGLLPIIGQHSNR